MNGEVFYCIYNSHPFVISVIGNIHIYLQPASRSLLLCSDPFSFEYNVYRATSYKSLDSPLYIGAREMTSRGSDGCGSLFSFIVLQCSAGMPRERYRRVSDDDRQRIVAAFREGQDYVACAAQLGVRRGTAYSIVRRFQTTGHSQQRRPTKQDGRRNEGLLCAPDGGNAHHFSPRDEPVNEDNMASQRPCL